MSLKVLELGRFGLASSTEALQLDVVSAADFKGPRSIANLDTDAFLRAVTSRQLWVSRGRGCRIDIEVLLNGKPLNRIYYSQLLESLGSQIQDAKPWKQLLLSTSLDLILDVPNEQTPHLSIHLNNSIKPPAYEGGLAAWIGDTDVKPPHCVPCFELERIQVQFDFTLMSKGPLVQVPEFFSRENETFDDMLLDTPVEIRSNQKVDGLNLEQVVEVLKSLPSQVASCFGTLGSNSSDDQSLLTHVLLSNVTAPKICGNDPPPGLSTTPYEVSDRPQKSSRKISKKAVDVLDAWAAAHRDSMYPTMAEKSRLVLDTGLSRRQVDSQLCWYRRKMKATSTNDVYAAVQKKIRLDDAGSNDVADAGWAEDMLLDHDVGHTGIKDFDEDEPLLSQTSDVASSFFLSQASTLSNSYMNNLLGPDDTSLTGPHFEWSSSQMGSSAPSRLAEVAFGALMGASISRQDLGVRDVDMKDHPQLSISTLVPSMFSPGFKNSMAGNCRLLPTVTHVLSISLPRTVQTPSLRRKLVQLSNMNVSQFQNSQDLGQVGTTERLSSVVQLRIWEMMQRKLFDKSAERRLWRQARAGEEEAEEDFEDILEISDGGGLKWETGAGQGFSHAEMLFWDDDDDDDLLLGDDNAYCEIDWERRAIEQYTDEMLLDDVWSDNWRDGREEMLLEDSDHDNLENGEERSILLFEESDDEMLLIRDGETSIFQ